MSGACADCGGPDYQTLEARVAELEAKVKWYAGVVMDYTAVLERAEQAEAALAERDRMLRLAWFWHDRSPQHETFDAFLADLRARAEEGSG